MGNKKKLINKGLIELFPKNINTFVDLFCGSGVVSMNVEANNYILNDFDENVYNLYKMFKEYNYNSIINHIENRINKYGLAKERTKRNEFKDKEKINQYKNAYANLRSFYNKDKNILDFYTLMFYSFSQQFRFNSKGEFNMPCGNDCFSDKNKDYVKKGGLFFSKENISIYNQDFRKFKVSFLSSNDFVYLDPPYFNTTATYNENGGWSENDENDLYKFCEELNSNNIKLAMSNVFENKGIKNNTLIEWVEKNNFNVYTFDKFTYCACGKGNSNAKEVLITNY
jgi:DNA adenine methylase